MDYCRYVDLFLTEGEYSSSYPESPAKHIDSGAHSLCSVPYAALPFGGITAGLYTGGYPFGRGNLGPDIGRGAKRLYDKNMARGFSHFHPLGNSPCHYYNYAVVTPFYGELKNALECYEIRNETALPGYYSADFGQVYCELTVGRRAAYHHYFFEKSGGRVAIDFSNDGLCRSFGNKFYSMPGDVHLEVNASGEVFAGGIYGGIRLYFCASLEGLDVRCSLFDGSSMIASAGHTPCSDRYGAVYDFSGDSVIVKVGCSAHSYDDAKARVRESLDSFDTTMNKAYAFWNRALSGTAIETEDEAQLCRHYTQVYHSVLKAAGISFT